MCVVSNTGDYFGQRLPKRFPFVEPFTGPPTSPLSPVWPPADVKQQQIDDLKKEVEIMKELLIRAKKYDEENNEPECHVEEKLEKLRTIAKLVGIDLDEVIKPKPTTAGQVDKKR